METPGPPHALSKQPATDSNLLSHGGSNSYDVTRSESLVEETAPLLPSRPVHRHERRVAVDDLQGSSVLHMAAGLSRKAVSTCDATKGSATTMRVELKGHKSR